MLRWCLQVSDSHQKWLRKVFWGSCMDFHCEYSMYVMLVRRRFLWMLRHGEHVLLLMLKEGESGCGMLWRRLSSCRVLSRAVAVSACLVKSKIRANVSSDTGPQLFSALRLHKPDVVVTLTLGRIPQWAGPASLWKPQELLALLLLSREFPQPSPHVWRAVVFSTFQPSVAGCSCDTGWVFRAWSGQFSKQEVTSWLHCSFCRAYCLSCCPPHRSGAVNNCEIS